MTFPSNVTGKNWMSFLDGRKSIADLSIPGTHDSGAIWGEFGLRGVAKSLLSSMVPKVLRDSKKTMAGGLTSGLLRDIDSGINSALKDIPNFNFAKDQDKTIQQQLDMGVRMLDLRFRNINGELYVYHGQSPQGESADTALSTVRNFLKQNDKETVLVHIQQASSGPIESLWPHTIRLQINSAINAYNSIRCTSFFGFKFCLPKADSMPTMPSLPAKSIPLLLDNSGLQTLHISENTNFGLGGIFADQTFGINMSYPEKGSNSYAPTLNRLINKYENDFYLKNQMPTLDDARGKMVLINHDNDKDKKQLGLLIPNTDDTGDCSIPSDAELANQICEKPNVMPESLEDIPSSKTDLVPDGYKMYVQNTFSSPTLSDKISKFIHNLDNSISGRAKNKNAFIYNFLSAYNTKTQGAFGARFYSDRLNPLLPGLLQNHKGTSQTGNILLDFMTPALAKAIYETNDLDYFPQIKLTTTAAQDADLPLTRKEPSADAGIKTDPLDPQIHRYNGVIGADKFNDTRKILDSLSFAFNADEPVEWSLTGASSADFELDAKSDFSTKAQITYNSNRPEVGHQSSRKDDYSADLSTTASIELSDGTKKTLSGILNRPEGDSKLEFAVEAVDRYRNLKVTEFDITIEASEAIKSHDVDWIRVGLEKDRPVKLDTLSQTVADNPSRFYMTGIYDETGSIVQTPVNSNKIIDTFTAPANGFYYIGLSADNTESDLSYSLDVTPLDNLPHDPNKKIVPTDDFSAAIENSGFLDDDNNNHQFGSIETVGDIDWFGIELKKGSNVDFGFARYIGDPEISKNAIIHAIFDDDEKQVGEIHNKNFIRFVAPKSDTYYIAVTSDTLTRYELGATINSVPEESQTGFVPNQPDDYSDDISTIANLDIKNKKNKLNANIDYSSDTDWIRVGLEEGKSVDIEVESKDPNLTVSLNKIIDSKGNAIKGTSSIEKFTAPSTDFYYFEISSLLDKTGPYSVNVVSRSGGHVADEDILQGFDDDGLIDISEDKISLTMPKRFKKKFATKIKDFDPILDRLVISEDFETTESGLSLATARGGRKVKRKLSKLDDQFLYNERKGLLYFNENQSDKGFGDGGLIAIFKGAPDISIDNLTFL